MKLKKIASLALAGIMAVSMLAGCGEGNGNGNSGSSSENTNTTAGYSSTLAENLSAAAKEDYITYQDNSADAAALEDALGNLGSVITGTVSLAPKLVPIHEINAFLGVDLVIDDFVDALDIQNPKLRLQGAVDNLVTAPDDFKRNVPVKFGMLYVIDGSVNVDKAVKQVANEIDDALLSQLPKESDTYEVHYTYNYTVSVSVVNKAVESVDGYNSSANFIAVTVTRVPTEA